MVRYSNSPSRCERFYNRIVKRILDLLLSACGIVLLLPVCMAVAAAIILDDGFPVLYRGERTGYHAKPFRICKFRTMVRNADKIGGGTTALHDSRITKVGSILRKTKLDELPQLWQVFTGTMSLVGPRPELPCYTGQYQGEELDILNVKPGITDFSSLEFIDLDTIVGESNADLTYEQLVLAKKNALRVQYAHSVSFRTDIAILARTLWAVVRKSLRTVQAHNHRKAI